MSKDFFTFQRRNEITLIWIKPYKCKKKVYVTSNRTHNPQNRSSLIMQKTTKSSRYMRNSFVGVKVTSIASLKKPLTKRPGFEYPAQCLSYIMKQLQCSASLVKGWGFDKRRFLIPVVLCALQNFVRYLIWY